MNAPTIPAVDDRFRTITRTFNGHVLRSLGYTESGCLNLAEHAKSQPLVSNFAIFGPGDVLLHRFSRAHEGAPLLKESL